MHLLIIILLIFLAFPMFARFIGGFLSVFFWLIAAVAVVAIFGALSN
jgi:hypothetical protein